MPRDHRGTSLVELIVALLLLELAGAMALVGAVTVRRVDRRTAQRSAAQEARWARYHEAELAPACTEAGSPAATPILLGDGRNGPPLQATIRCGP